MLSNKIQLIKSYDEQILDSIDTDANMEREVFESSEFERTVCELIISINMWLKSHDDEVFQIELYLTLSKIQILKTLTSQSDLDYQDKKFRLFPAILYNFRHFGKFLIVQSIRIPVSLQLINFLILKPFSPEKQKMH